MIGRSLIILAVATLGATAVLAQSSKITVHRGSLTHTVELDSQGYALAPKVRIEQVPQVSAETATQANARKQGAGFSGPVPQRVAGQTFWLTDESGSGLIACRLVWAPPQKRWSGKGHWAIRCYTEDGDVTR
jgi:hypothetical protein